MVLKKVAVTGATGMLGRHITGLLEKNNFDVIKISKRDVRGVDYSWDLSEWKNNDFFDLIFSNVEVIIHAGAIVDPEGLINEEKIYDANIRSCLNIGEWARSRNIPIVYISGAIVYKNIFKNLQEEGDMLGWHGYGNFYGYSKLLAEDTFIRLKQKGLNVSILRPTSIYGIGMPSKSIVSKYLFDAIANKTIEIEEPVDDRIDFVHAYDVARSILAVLRNQKSGIYNISSGYPVSIKELAESCIEIAGKGNIKISGELPLDYVPSCRFSLNIDHAFKEINWKPEISLKNGLFMMKSNLLISNEF